MTHVTCRLITKNRDQLRNPTLGSRVWATFTYTFTSKATTAPRRWGLQHTSFVLYFVLFVSWHAKYSANAGPASFWPINSSSLGAQRRYATQPIQRSRGGGLSCVRRRNDVTRCNGIGMLRTRWEHPRLWPRAALASSGSQLLIFLICVNWQRKSRCSNAVWLE